MKNRWLMLGLVVVGLFVGERTALACGDKFLVVGRGIRYQRTAVPFRQATVLIYRNPDTMFMTPIQDGQLQATLRTAGHTVDVANGPQEMRAALQSGKYDIVLADLGDAPGVETQLQGVALKPILLPVIYNAQASDAAAAKKQYAHVVKAPQKSAQLLGAIDDVMKSKARS